MNNNEGRKEKKQMELVSKTFTSHCPPPIIIFDFAEKNSPFHVFLKYKITNLWLSLEKPLIILLNSLTITSYIL